MEPADVSGYDSDLESTAEECWSIRGGIPSPEPSTASLPSTTARPLSWSSNDERKRAADDYRRSWIVYVRAMGGTDRLYTDPAGFTWDGVPDESSGSDLSGNNSPHYTDDRDGVPGEGSDDDPVFDTDRRYHSGDPPWPVSQAELDRLRSPLPAMRPHEPLPGVRPHTQLPASQSLSSQYHWQETISAPSQAALGWLHLARRVSRPPVRVLLRWQGLVRDLVNKPCAAALRITAVTRLVAGVMAVV